MHCVVVAKPTQGMSFTSGVEIEATSLHPQINPFRTTMHSGFQSVVFHKLSKTQFKACFYHALCSVVSQLSVSGRVYLSVLIDNPLQSARRKSDFIKGVSFSHDLYSGGKPVVFYLYDF